MSSRKRILVLAMLLMLVGGPGCFGRFALREQVQEFNLEATQERWGRELLFVVLHIVPAYQIAGFIDLVIVNSIEFWTGENPISGESPIVDEVPEGDGGDGGDGGGD